MCVKEGGYTYFLYIDTMGKEFTLFTLFTLDFRKSRKACPNSSVQNQPVPNS